MKETAVGKRMSRRSLSVLARVTIFSLLIGALAYAVNTFQVYLAGSLVVPLIIITLVMFVAAGVSAFGLKWTPAVGALLALAILIGSYTQPYFTGHLAHPGDVGSFIPSVVITAAALVAIVAGVAATIQNYRSVDRPAPRGMGLVLSGVIGVVLGAAIVSLIVTANPSASSASSTSSNGEPTVHMGVTSFDQNVVLVPKGSKLLLVDDGQYQHILANGMWEMNGSPKPLTEPGAPTVNNVSITGGSLEIGPFTTAGVYHLYCTIHVHMNLTILVQ